MATGEVIAIGTELLLGEIQDTNIRFIARVFRDLGIDMYRANLVGDNAARIAQLVQEALQRAEVVITSGGLGPTVDDPTREAIAMAFGVPLEFRPELWQQITERYQRFGRSPGENARRQAYIPKGAVPIENPVGTAPAFYFETGERVVISLPGVPRELEFLMEKTVIPYLRQRFGLQGIIKTRVLRTAGVPESQIDEWLADYERFSNPTVGLSAHPGMVDIRITAKAASEAEADQMIETLASEIRPLLGQALYGEDNETLASVVAKLLRTLNWSLNLLECGLNGALTQTIEHALDKFNAEIRQAPCPEERPSVEGESALFEEPADVFLIASLKGDPDKAELDLYLRTPGVQKSEKRYFGGPPLNRPIWATNVTLDFLRRTLIQYLP
ncbi:CinA family nicotinamide mononucleotide deamidase-related protein [uncultured Thermanaerothrix sp.]|uniref:competence/damage-inducible protein A n=1 Tax=uncultured Thermanaerothrix sp. TaxID=1195149 RepID=UPI00261F0344|nr:CinA family nicotinamide mononucleotide deamidase-related protein [uncultured Thermanaerothrix sp.]